MPAVAGHTELGPAIDSPYICGGLVVADADLVLEGGGVKGTGLVGAITALTSAAEPYTFHRVAGTSAGAIVASMLAAGYDPAEMTTIMTDLDFSRFEDNPGLFA